MKATGRITRRRFLLGAALAGAALVMMGWPKDRGRLLSYLSAATNRIWPPAARLRYHFSYLTFEPGAIEQYVRDVEQHVGPINIAWREFHTRLLLSTDFFLNDEDETRVIRYVTFYDPSLTLCSNPFARFD